MKKLNKTTAVSLAVTLCALTGITAYAYLGAQNNKENKVNVAESDVTISEKFTEPVTMEISNIFEKKVWFENKKETVTTGSTIVQSDCFIRAFVDFSDSRIKGKSKISYDGINYYSWDDFLKNLPENWIYIPESDTNLGGYFYYTKVLKPGDKTSELISSVKTDFDNYDDISDFDIIVYAETVQTTDTNGTVFTDSEWMTAWERFLYKT